MTRMPDHRDIVVVGGGQAGLAIGFLGLPWQHTRGSALLGWVKHDAAHLSERIRDGAPVAATAPRPLADTPPVAPNRIGELA